LDLEYFDSFDETDFENGNEFSEDSYGVIKNSVLIDNHQILLTRTVKENEILYTGSVPPSIAKKDTSVDISFSIQFLLEKDSYLNFIFELPIQELECAINYEDVRDEIFIGGTYYLSSNRDHPPFDRGRREHEFFVKQKGWVMPKSSLVFIWWKQNR
jgi:hypothetical protein